MLKFIASLFASSAPKSSAANAARLELNTMEERLAPALIAVSNLSDTTLVRTTTDTQLESPLAQRLHNYDLVTGFFGR